MKSIIGDISAIMNTWKTLQKIALLTTVICFSGCSRNQQVPEEDARVKVPVTVTSMKIKPMADYFELFATSRFQNKSIISAPVTGYIESVLYNPGDAIKRGEEIFLLRTKEAEVLRNDSMNQYYFPGLVHVKASIDGMLISLNHAKGDYVMEGEALGNISLLSSLVFLLDVPFESTSYVKMNTSCKILLPDGDSVPGRIISRLPSMTEGSQTQQFMVRPESFHNIPENLIAKIRVTREYKPEATVLPQSCILTDEVMKNFWVMKLINDTVAVRTNVVTGLKEGNDVEILQPSLGRGDLFLASGNYGLGDTVIVEIKGLLRNE